jgi:hypothetical protein
MDQDCSLIGAGDGERVRGYMISKLGLLLAVWRTKAVLGNAAGHFAARQ